jgi:hypothetical protein
MAAILHIAISEMNIRISHQKGILHNPYSHASDRPQGFAHVPLSQSLIYEHAAVA